MKNKVKLIAVFLVALIATVILTSRYYERQYKVDCWGLQSDLEITGFKVVPEDNLSLSMFDNSFDVYVTIDCKIKNKSFDSYIEYVHKSERIEYTDGKTVVVEFVPVVGNNSFKDPEQLIKRHTEKFKYTLNGYDSSNKKYIFRCGDFEEVISFSSGK